MSLDNPNKDQFADLRARAAQILKGEEVPLEEYNPKDVQRLLNELRVYHIELELQNDELRETQQQLSLARDKYADLYHFAPVAYFTFDQNGVIQELNLAASNLLQRERRHLINQPFITNLPPDKYRDFRLLLNSVLESDQPQRRELIIQRRSGETIPVEVEAILAQSHSDEPPLCRMVMIDISERKKAEEAIVRAQKMESLTVLAGGVAHDFNNLLVAMHNQVELAQFYLKEKNSDQATWHLIKAQKASERAADLTRQLLSYAGHHQLEKTLVDLNNLLEENLTLFHASSGNRVRVTLNLAPNLPLVETDIGQMQQVIMNLIINAIEAIETSTGEILISSDICHIRQDDAAYWQIDSRLLEPGTYVRLTVRDSGTGMEPAVLKRIFDPFFSTKFTGRGLGLAAVMGIVKAHHGGIHVDSKVGEGTIFQMVLPASDKTMPSVIPVSKSSPDQIATAGKIILIIDDEVAVREAVKDILNIFGQEATAVASGEEGIQYYRQHYANIQLVLLDLTMPGYSGIETLKRLREIEPDIPVILSSGYTKEDMDSNLKNLNVHGYLQKPYNVQGLMETLRPFISESN